MDWGCTCSMTETDQELQSNATMSIAPKRTNRDTYSGRVEEDPPSSSSLEVSIASEPVAVSVAISHHFMDHAVK